MKLAVGLTGGIGSGKSTVAERLAALGATIVDTDVLAHTLTGAGGAAMAEIAREFGPGFLAADGALDRAAMRRAAFDDAGDGRAFDRIAVAAAVHKAGRWIGAPHAVRLLDL